MAKRSRKQTYSKKYIDAIFYKLSSGCAVLLGAKNKENEKLSLMTNKENTTKNEVNVSKCSKKSKDDKASKENTSPPPSKKPKLNPDGRDALKLVLFREGEAHKFKSQFKSLLTSNNEIASTSTDYAPVVIDCEESAKSANSSHEKEDESIWIIDVKEMMDEDNYRKWMKMAYSNKKSTNQRSCTKKLAVPTSRPKVKAVKRPLNGNKNKRDHLIEIDKLFKKYFPKYVQDTVVIIANILIIISTSNMHYTSQIDKSFKSKSKAEKLGIRNGSNRIYLNRITVLETMLKKNFTDVVTSFTELDFNSAFHLFFLSLLSILRILEHPNFKKGGLFKNVVHLLFSSLKNSGYSNSNVFSILNSRTFRAKSIDLITMIENGQEIDPGVTDSMSFFFIKTLKTRVCFEAVIDAVTSDSEQDLRLLMDHATSQCRLNSQFRDPVDSSTLQHLNAKIPISAINKNCDTIIEHTFIQKNSDGTYQQTPIRNGNTLQYTGNTALEKSIVMSQPSNNLYQRFSSPVQMKTYEPSSSKAMPENKCVVVAPTVYHGLSAQVTSSTSRTLSSSGTGKSIPTTTSVALKPLFQNNKSVANSPLIETDGGTSTSGAATSIPTTTPVTLIPLVQNNKSVTNSPVIKNDGGTCRLGNKQYRFVKGSLLSGPMRGIINGTNNISVNSTQTSMKCYARNCFNPAHLMCSDCKTAKYCSKVCQINDWRNGHKNNCKRLRNERNQP